jgi:spore coat polysaccharide biosynthesis protein SpsF (cytidylyltransferase family)
LKKAIIIQARMSSKRLPGKVLREFGNGKTLLEIQLLRIQELTEQDIEIIVATSKTQSDDVLVDYLSTHFKWVKIYRGDLNNVMQRYYDAAITNSIGTIIRITADCPFIDPVVVSKMLQVFEESDLDYLANAMPPGESTFSDGFDVEIFSIAALLKQMNLPGLTEKDKEHVTFLFWGTTHFKTALFANTETPNFQFKLSVDSMEDFVLADTIIKSIGYKKSFSEIEFFIAANENVRNINSENKKNSGWNL